MQEAHPGGMGARNPPRWARLPKGGDQKPLPVFYSAAWAIPPVNKPFEPLLPTIALDTENVRKNGGTSNPLLREKKRFLIIFPNYSTLCNVFKTSLVVSILLS